MKIKEAIILAGGKGTRLRSVVSDIPKPMAPICDKPFLEILIENFHAKGIDHFILSVGYLSEHIIKHFEKKYSNLNISFSIENEALGTGGAIQQAFKFVNGNSALVLNGDSFFNVDLTALLPFSSTDIPIIFGRYVDDVSRYGSFLYNENKIYHYSEKQKKGAGYINGGVYVLGKETLSAFSSKKNFSLEKDYFSLFSKNNEATIIFSNNYFIDIGIPESYQKAQHELISFFDFQSK